ncbi:carbon monoxide dehydrogenase [Bordetella avium]|uniref:xanthine dehydrogenase family Fe-S subunit n=1 Tax=Bordetella avium TaxID=521 RepID=UPI000FD7135F|nr:2Fe-2S iron-sulfur cluster-binding protein [Bordetella avium]AZY48962.1 carbon monoxide dehydrogenase [Bordetella avium]
MSVVSINLNGIKLRRDVQDRTHLGDFIREEGRQTGTHLGCEHGVCGACTVLVDGVPVRSCISFAPACEGKSVTSVEGYQDDPIMALLRPAFSKHHGLQCGYCTPGMLTTARDIVLRFPYADEAKVRLELSGNLCRCTGYKGIVAAILDVLEQCRSAPAAIAELRAAAAKGRQCWPAQAAAPAAFAPFSPEDVGAASQSADADNNARSDGAAFSALGAKVEGDTVIEGGFTVNYPADQVWKFMADLPAVASCLPGAQLTDHEKQADGGERVKGHVGIKFGPMSAAFNGSAKLQRDEANRAAVLKGAGTDSLSQSRATGNIAFIVQALDESKTRVSVNLGFSLQGPLAQFSRSGLVKDFVGRLIQEFGKNVGLRLDPNRSADDPLPVAKLNAFSLAWSVLIGRIKRLFGRS